MIRLKFLVLRGAGRGGCTLKLPKNAKGKRLLVTMFVTYKGVTDAFEPYVFKVRWAVSSSDRRSLSSRDDRRILLPWSSESIGVELSSPRRLVAASAQSQDEELSVTTRKPHNSHVLAASVAALLLVLTVAATGGSASGAAAPGPTAVVGLDLDPLCLNVLLNDCNTNVSHVVAGPVLAGAFRVLPDFSFEPVLVDHVDVQAQPFALTYHIRPQAVWSDGAPVTADDFIFTLETILDPANNTLKSGYEHVTDAVRVDAKTVTVRFAAPNPDWQTLFQYVLPKHVLAGHDFDQVWRDGIDDPATHAPIGSGPFLVTGWTRGESLTATRNPRWWGPTGPFLDSIVFRIVPSANDQFAGLRNGTLDLIFPQAQLGIADIGRVDGITVQSAPGTGMEHLDFNVQPAGMSLLRERWFRQAVAYAIDRDAVAAASYNTLVPNYPALHNLTFASAHPAYQPVFARYAHDAAAVAVLMLDHGCVRGGDGIWSCAGIRASVRFATTAGNLQRELVQQDMVAQARAAGIELVPDNSPAGFLFGSRLGARDYELIMFTWVRGSAFPSLRALYACGGEQNFTGYCSQAVTDLALRVDVEVDPAVRAQLANDANRILADDMPSLPLFQRITFLVQRDALRGPRLNPGGFGLWNVETWRLGPDVTPPSTTAVAAPAANASGWNNGPVTVQLTAVDDDTGVQDVRYELTGAQTGGAVVAGDSAEVVVTTEGVTTLEFYATDASGNAEPPRTLTIRIDRTAPGVSCSSDPARLWPPNRKLVPVRTVVTVDDATSGASGFTLVSVAGGGPEDAVGFDPGTPDTAGSLRAELDLGRRTRLYTLVYEGVDRAGNTSRCTADVAVRVDG